jgi:DNA-binding LacI/PurR family transcriptional regulator
MPTLQNLEGPKYQTLANLFKAQIEQGEFKPGDRLPSFTEMRAQYGATPTTVERVYSQLEQERLIIRERGRGTFVCQPEVRPMTGVIGINGIVFSANLHPYWAQIMEGFHEVAARNGLELLLLNESSAINWEKVDGIITPDLPKEQLEAMLQRMPPKMPCVATLFETGRIACILADDYQGAYEITNYLIEQGHRRIAYLINPISITSRRLAGYYDAMRDSGIEVEPGWVHPLEEPEEFVPEGMFNFLKSGTLSMRNWLDSDWASQGCTALMAQNDDAAIGAIRTLQERGIRVPEDLSVAGFDGTDTIQYFSPNLTTIKVPLREIGVAAIETLLRQIRGESLAANKLMLPARLMVGQSTRAITP